MNLNELLMNQKQINPKSSRQAEIMKIQSEIHEIEMT